MPLVRCLTLFGLLLMASARPVAGSDQIYFPATDNVITQIVNRINAETVRIDISAWYLTEHAISIAIANRFAAGVRVRLIGDRGAIFEIDPNTKSEFYWLANVGVPIRLRYNPSWFPEIDHWKMAIFVGQNVVEFGSANWTTFELAPTSSTNYDDETTMFTDDPVLVGAFKTKFDVMWNDTTNEPESIVSGPYLKNWYDACALESACSDFRSRYPNPAPMNIDTSRLVADNPMPADLIWGQGPDFNNRLTTEINRESSEIDFVIYRLTVDGITQALLSKRRAGVAMKLLIEPDEYMNRKWPEFWLTHANIDRLWAAGVPIRQRAHQGMTHMKTLVTSAYATNASSNYAANWQRDHDYFVSSSAKPAIYSAIRNRVLAMWNDSSGFAPFTPQPADTAVLVGPPSTSTGVSTVPTLTWKAAAFATSYDVYWGTSQSSLSLVGNVPAQLTANPPSTYSFSPTWSLATSTRYYWKIVSRTFATDVDPSITASSDTWNFTTNDTATQPPPAPDPPPPPAPAPPPPPSPSATSSTFGDFNADGHPDLVWRNTNGGFIAWLMNGVGYSGGATLGLPWVDPSWRAAAFADMDGDGNLDIIWEQSSGGLAVWLMNGLGLAQAAVPEIASVDPSWKVVAAADLNGDGHPDLVWQNGQGTVAAWLMNGLRVIAPVVIGQLGDPSWRIVGTADLNGDGNADLIWEHPSGAIGAWLMNGTSFVAAAPLGPGQVDPSWQIVAVADFDGDGRADLVWQNSAGAVVVWYMNGYQLKSVVSLPFSVDPSWRIVGPK